MAEWVHNQRNDYHGRRQKLPEARQARLEALPGWTWDARQPRQSCPFLYPETLHRCGKISNLQRAGNGLKYCMRHKHVVDGEPVRGPNLPAEDPHAQTHRGFHFSFCDVLGASWSSVDGQPVSQFCLACRSRVLAMRLRRRPDLSFSEKQESGSRCRLSICVLSRRSCHLRCCFSDYSRPLEDRMPGPPRTKRRKLLKSDCRCYTLSMSC